MASQKKDTWKKYHKSCLEGEPFYSLFIGAYVSVAVAPLTH